MVTPTPQNGAEIRNIEIEWKLVDVATKAQVMGDRISVVGRGFNCVMGDLWVSPGIYLDGKPLAMWPVMMYEDVEEMSEVVTLVVNVIRATLVTLESEE